MATLAQLQAEPWWGNEVEPSTLDTLMDRLCVRYSVPRYNAGGKGNEFHLYGRHRSIEWSLNSAYCTDRSYGTVDGRDRRGNWRHIRAFDLKLPAAQLYAMCRRLDTAVRAGQLPKVAEWFGTFDGVNVVGWYEGHPSSSDDSHLWHLHLGFWTENADDDHSDLFAILTGDDVDAVQNAKLTNANANAWAVATLSDPVVIPGNTPGATPETVPNALRQRLDAIDKALEALGAKLADPVDEAALAKQLAPLLQQLGPGATVDEIAQLLGTVRLSAGA